MQTSLKAFLVVGALLFGAAEASTGSMGNTTSGFGTSASGSVRAEVRAAVLLDAQGRTVGTFGSGQLAASAAVRAATQVRVTFEGGVTKTYTLAQTLNAQGKVVLESLVVRSGDKMASLGQVLRADLQVARVLGGKSVTLVDGGGIIVGTFQADGSLRASGDVQQATDVVVTLEGGRRVRYGLAGGVAVDAGGTLQLGSVHVRDHNGSVALVNVLVNLRQSASAVGDTKGGTTSGEQSASTSASAGAATAAGTSGTGSTSGGSAGAGVSVSVGVSVGGGIGVGIGGGK